MAAAKSDDLSPITSATVAASYFNVATFSITATDGDGVGVDTTYWRIDDSAVTSVTQPAAISIGPLHTVGEHHVEYWSTDLAGNVEATNTATFVILDTLPPTTFADVDSSYFGPAVINIFSDAEGGTPVARTFYKVDDGEVTTISQPATITVTVAESGTHTIMFWSRMPRATSGVPCQRHSRSTILHRST